MKLNTCFLASIIFSILISSCSTSDMATGMMDNPIETEQMILSNTACQHDSLAVDTLFFDLGDGDFVKVPTVFTPNDDGIDDFFFPRFDYKEEMVISSYSIYAPAHWNNLEGMYSASRLNYDENNNYVGRGWDGIARLSSEPGPMRHEGAFMFRFYATKYDAEGNQVKFKVCRGWGCVDRN